MGIKRDLKREGIEIIEQIDTLTINSLARSIADTISRTFPELNLDTKQLFMRISRLNMYFANLPTGISAKYFYKNKTIYFANNIEEKNLVSVAIHECIHYLQEKCDKSGEIVTLGLCDYTNSKLPGTGLNEAAVQLMAAKCAETPYESEKYFGIEISTNTPTYYPLECALVNQMAYLVGEDVIFESTLNANNKFKEQYISLTSVKEFETIQKNIDLLVEAQEKIENLYIGLQEYDIDEVYTKKTTKEIDNLKLKVKQIFIKTQELILTSYFDNAINLTYSPKLIENYRNKLYGFKDTLGIVDGYNFYNDYYINKMVELEKRYDIDNSEITDLVVVKHSFFGKIIRKIKALFGFNPEYADIKERK